MNILDEKLKEIKESKQLGIMAHVVIGYPSLEATISLVKTMSEAGVSIVELQIPFSDPLADGPTIMKACEKALENGTKVKDAFVVMKTLSSAVGIPLLFMAYYNTVFVYGVEKFCHDAKTAGAAGLIVPDMSIDEEAEEHFYAACKKYDLHTIHVISPASTDEQLKKNAKVASGFVYCTARQGTTGAKEELAPNMKNYLQKIRKFFSIPIAVGFGISKKEHVRALEKNADIAVIGSAVIDLINSSSKATMNDTVKRFLTDLMVQ